MTFQPGDIVQLSPSGHRLWGWYVAADSVVQYGVVQRMDHVFETHCLVRWMDHDDRPLRSCSVPHACLQLSPLALLKGAHEV